MASEKPDEKCRLCLNEAGVQNVFKTDDLKQMIEEIVCIKILPVDSLSESICEICFNIINKAKELKTIAIKNNSYLMSQFCSTKEEKITDGVPCLATCDTRNNATSPSKVVVDGTNKRTTAPRISVRRDLCVKSDSPEESETVASKSQGQLKRKSDEKNKTIKIRISNYSSSTESNGKVEFVCDKCDKSFDRAKSFYFHQRSHVKAYNCPVHLCGKGFSSNGDLKKHIRTHTGEKPYICEICSKGFAQRVTLKQHYVCVHHLDDS